LIRELADETGESMTQAVTIAVRERLERIRARDSTRSERVWAIVREISLPAAGRLPGPGLRPAAVRRRDQSPEVIVDTSAFMAILQGEPDAEAFGAAVRRARRRSSRRD